MPNVRLTWTNNSSGHDGQRVRMDAPSSEGPDTVIADLGPNVEEYIALSAVEPEACFTVAAYEGGAEEESGVACVETADTSGQIIGVALVDDSVQGGSFVWIDEAGNEIAQPDTAWFDAHPAFQLSDETIDGQHMVRVPKSYWKRDQITVGAHGTCDCWWVAPAAATGFQVFRAFEYGAGEVDQFWLGKYEGRVTDNKLQSIPDVSPTGLLSWSNVINAGVARNTGGVEGFRLAHVDMRVVVQWLYLVEFGTFDSQSTTAPGHTAGGVVQSTSSAANAAASYRGVYALWGNCAEWIDGVRHVDGDIKRRTYTGAWTTTGVSRPTADEHFPDSISPAPGVADMFVASTHQATEPGALVPDKNAWRNSSTRVGAVGGDKDSGVDGGLWSLRVNYTTGDWNPSDIAACGRLARVI